MRLLMTLEKSSYLEENPNFGEDLKSVTSLEENKNLDEELHSDNDSMKEYLEAKRRTHTRAFLPKLPAEFMNLDKKKSILELSKDSGGKNTIQKCLTEFLEGK